MQLYTFDSKKWEDVKIYSSLALKEEEKALRSVSVAEAKDLSAAVIDGAILISFSAERRDQTVLDVRIHQREPCVQMSGGIRRVKGFKKEKKKNINKLQRDD